MNETANWWEEVFTGPMSLGLNKERLNELQEESFIYFQSDTTIEETASRHS